MYNVELDKTYDFEMYNSHSTQYSEEDLFMAAAMAKSKIENEVMHYYSGGLVMTISMADFHGAKICFLLDYQNREAGIVYMNGTFYNFKMLYGDKLMTVLSKKLDDKEEATFAQIYKAIEYMLVFHCDDIIEKCKETFSRVCQVDGSMNTYIEAFKKLHAKGDESDV